MQNELHVKERAILFFLCMEPQPLVEPSRTVIRLEDAEAHRGRAAPRVGDHFQEDRRADPPFWNSGSTYNSSILVQSS